MKKDDFEIEPEDMPMFLNELASITKDKETRFKLAQCSAFIFGIIHTFKKGD